MGRKKKMKDVVSLMAQSKAHGMLADDNEINAKDHTREFWRKESTRYQEQMDEIIDKARFPKSYIHKIEAESRRKSEILYHKKKRDLRKK